MPLYKYFPALQIVHCKSGCFLKSCFVFPVHLRMPIFWSNSMQADWECLIKVLRCQPSVLRLAKADSASICLPSFNLSFSEEEEKAHRPCNPFTFVGVSQSADLLFLASTTSPSIGIWCKYARSHWAIVNTFAVNSFLSVGLCLMIIQITYNHWQGSCQLLPRSLA